MSRARFTLGLAIDGDERRQNSPRAVMPIGENVAPFCGRTAAMMRGLGNRTMLPKVIRRPIRACMVTRNVRLHRYSAVSRVGRRTHGEMRAENLLRRTDMLSTILLFSTVLVSRPAVPLDSLHLVFTVQPSATVAGAPITPAVQVSVVDAAGQTVATFARAVTVEISDGTGNEDAELSGTTTVRAVAGVATFGALSIDSAGAEYTLTAAVEGAGEVTSAPFAVTAPAAAAVPVAVATAAPGGGSGSGAARAEFTVQPSRTAAGAPIQPTVAITV